MVFFGSRLGSAVGEIRIDLTQLFNARAVAKEVIHSITADTEAAGFQFAQLSGAAIAGLSAIALGGVGAATGVEKITDKFKLMIGSEQQAQAEMQKLRQLAEDANQPFLDVLDAASSMVPVLKGTNVELVQATSLMQRLALLDPAQGIRGAGIALRDFVTGQYLPLAFRFELDRDSLKTITQGADGDPAKAIEGLDALLTRLNLGKEQVAAFGKTGANVFATLKDEITQSIAVGFTPLEDALKSISQLLITILRSVRDVSPALLEMAGSLVAVVAASAAAQKLGVGGGPLSLIRGAADLATSSLPGADKLTTFVQGIIPTRAVDPLTGEITAGLSATTASAIASLAPLAAAAAAVIALTVAIGLLVKISNDARDAAMAPLRSSIKNMADEAARASSEIPQVTLGIRSLIDIQLAGIEQQVRKAQEGKEQVAAIYDAQLNELRGAIANAVAPVITPRGAQDIFNQQSGFNFNQDQIKQLSDLFTKSPGTLQANDLSGFNLDELQSIVDKVFGPFSELSQKLRELGEGAKAANADLDATIGKGNLQLFLRPFYDLVASLGVGSKDAEIFGKRITDTVTAINESWSRHNTVLGFVNTLIDATADGFDRFRGEVADMAQSFATGLDTAISGLIDASKKIDEINQIRSDAEFESGLKAPRTALGDTRAAFEYALQQARQLAAFQRQSGLSDLAELQKEEDAANKIVGIRDQENADIQKNLLESQKVERRALQDHLATISDDISKLHFKLRDALIARNGDAALSALQNAKESVDSENQKYDTAKERRAEDNAEAEQELKDRYDAQVAAGLAQLQQLKDQYTAQKIERQFEFDEAHRQAEADHIRQNYFRDIDRQLDEQDAKARQQRQIERIAGDNVLIQTATGNWDAFLVHVGTTTGDLVHSVLDTYTQEAARKATQDAIQSSINLLANPNALLAHPLGPSGFESQTDPSALNLLANPNAILAPLLAEVPVAQHTFRMAVIESAADIKDAEDQATQSIFRTGVRSHQTVKDVEADVDEVVTYHRGRMAIIQSAVDGLADSTETTVFRSGVRAHQSIKDVSDISVSVFTDVGARAGQAVLGIGNLLSGIISSVQQTVTQTAFNIGNTLGSLIRNGVQSFASNVVAPTAQHVVAPTIQNASANSALQAFYRSYNSFAGGIDNVPYDMFPVQLHRDEAVLTASENRSRHAGSQLGNIYVDFAGANIGKNVTDDDLKALEATVVGGILQAARAVKNE